jgi:hypothetical protein
VGVLLAIGEGVCDAMGDMDGTAVGDGAGFITTTYIEYAPPIWSLLLWKTTDEFTGTSVFL